MDRGDQGVEADLGLHLARLAGLGARALQHLPDEIGSPAPPRPIRRTPAGVVVAHRERLVLHQPHHHRRSVVDAAGTRSDCRGSGGHPVDPPEDVVRDADDGRIRSRPGELSPPEPASVRVLRCGHERTRPTHHDRIPGGRDGDGGHWLLAHRNLRSARHPLRHDPRGEHGAAGLLHAQPAVGAQSHRDAGVAAFPLDLTAFDLPARGVANRDRQGHAVGLEESHRGR